MPRSELPFRTAGGTSSYDAGATLAVPIHQSGGWWRPQSSDLYL